MVENRSHLSETMIRSLMLALLLLSPLASITAAELNLYSARHYDTDFSLYERFTEETGIKVNLIEGGSDALIERILAEGELSPADILITVDAGRLWRAAEAGIFQQVDSA
ncbi:MAG: iron(III) transport system substrate-binding protein, partial [Candidatus Azotimanducaceae bacterium]